METPLRSKPSTSLQNPNVPATSPLPPPSSFMRLWRPAAQRNLRNQWSKLAPFRSEWASSSSAGRSHATSLVNAHLSQKYMAMMELGVLSDMPSVREKASSKLLKQQELHRTKLVSSYKVLLGVVAKMVAVSKSMRLYANRAAGSGGSSIVQFSGISLDDNDSGDGGGIPVFTFWSVSVFEQLADELVQMFVSELTMKRLVVVELLNISCEVAKEKEICWSKELYIGEFDQLRECNLYSKETGQPIQPTRLMEMKSNINTTEAIKFVGQPNSEILQVYLTTWLCEVNIDTQRVDEILAMVGEEMHVNLS
ncbi:hypothetical protein LINGRAHAP2_LOCUS9733 [Linum grandiflorum]